jgi:hypothetical protein
VTVRQRAEEQERDDAQECLDHLLGHIVHSPVLPGYPFRYWLRVAIDEEGEWLSEARRIVDLYEVRIEWPDAKNRVGSLYIKNNATRMNAVYAATNWKRGWNRVLRKLRGADKTEPMKFDTSARGKAHRATRIPLDYIPSQAGKVPRIEDENEENQGFTTLRSVT